MTGHNIIAQTQLLCQIGGYFSIEFPFREGIGVTSKMVIVDSRPLERSSNKINNLIKSKVANWLTDLVNPSRYPHQCSAYISHLVNKLKKKPPNILDKIQ